GFVAIHNIRLSQLAPLRLPLFGLEKKIREGTTEQLRTVIIAEHAHQGRVDIFQLSVGIRQIDAFLQGLKQVLEAGLAFALGGYIACQNAYTLSGTLVYESMRDALEISCAGFMPQADAQHAGSMALLEQGEQFTLQ